MAIEDVKSVSKNWRYSSCGVILTDIL